jgi:hypothetical protein
VILNDWTAPRANSVRAGAVIYTSSIPCGNQDFLSPAEARQLAEHLRILATNAEAAAPKMDPKTVTAKVTEDDWEF